MRHSGLWAICAVTTVLFTGGCGGGSGGNSSPAVVNGVWTGASTQTRAVANTTTLQADFVQTGTTVSGILIASGSNGSTISAFIGTINGNRLNATLSTPDFPGGNTVAQRTEQFHGLPAPSIYSTNSPFDISRPLIVSVGNRELDPAEYRVESATLYSNRIYIFAPVPVENLVKIQYYPYIPSASNTATLTGTVSGTRITGTYSVANTNSTRGGTFTLTHSTGVTTPRVAGILYGTYTPAGGAPQSIDANFTQHQDVLRFTGPNGNAFSGSGAIIGNNVTLIVPAATSTAYFTGVYSQSPHGTIITGSTLDSQGKTGVFSLEPDALRPPTADGTSKRVR